MSFLNLSSDDLGDPGRSRSVSFASRLLAFLLLGSCATTTTTTPQPTSQTVVVGPSVTTGVASDRADIAKLLGLVARTRIEEFTRTNYALGAAPENAPLRSPPCANKPSPRTRDALRAALPELRKHNVSCLAETPQGSFLVADITTGHGDCNGAEATDERILLWADSVGNVRFRRLATATNGISGCPCPVVLFDPFVAYAAPFLEGGPGLVVTTSSRRLVVARTPPKGANPIRILELTEESALEYREPWFVERTGQAFAEDAHYRVLTAAGFAPEPQVVSQLRSADETYRDLELLRALTPEKPQELDFPAIKAARKHLQL